MKKMKVFITGGTGTLGKALIKRFHKKWDIVSYSRDELKLSQIEREYPDVEFIIGDVKDYPSLKHAMRGCDAIIHAAAMKRVEVCELHPFEAIQTNVIGAQNVVRAALANNIKKAVVTGSDKGVESNNTYGMTKALQERIFTHSGFNSVRYGNVFGSRGSVAPLFADQARQGIQLTVTDPDMTRFLLTIDDAVDLVSMALLKPMLGDIFIKKSPAARLIDIAHAFSDDIKIIGKSRGEKLHEMLITAEEFTRLKKITGDFVAIGKKEVTSEYGKPFTSDQTRMLTVKEIRELAKKHKLL